MTRIVIHTAITTKRPETTAETAGKGLVATTGGLAIVSGSVSLYWCIRRWLCLNCYIVLEYVLPMHRHLPYIQSWDFGIRIQTQIYQL